MTDSSVLMLEPQFKPESTTHPYLLIVAEDHVDVTMIVNILQKEQIIFDYQIVSSQNNRCCYSPYIYDAIVYNYRQKEEDESPVEKLAWWLKPEPEIPIILITDALGDEKAVACIQAGISGYVLRNKLESLPKILQCSLLNFAKNKQQKQRLQQQNLLNLIIQARIENYLSADFLFNTANLLYGQFSVSKCLIYTTDNNYCFKDCFISSESSGREREKFLYLCSQISNSYSCSLSQGKCLIPAHEEQKIPKVIKKIINTYQVKSLLIAPMIFQNFYLGGICLNHSQDGHKWTENDLIFVKNIANQCALALFDYQKNERLEQQWKQRQQQLDKEKQQIETTREAKLELFSYLTHELRTPLTGILGFAKMLGEQIYGELNPKQIQYIKAILDSGEHLFALINDLLDMSKIDAEREELFLEKIAVEDLCLASISIVQEIARQNNLELKLEIDDKISFCVVDQRRLKQILVNLLSNAIKFTEVGSVTLKISPAGKMINFAVIDTGIGISEADQQKLFQPFSQVTTHLHRQHKGTGLGLVLSRKLARLHGGELTATSTEGKGSCFTLQLPHE